MANSGRSCGCGARGTAAGKCGCNSNTGGYGVLRYIPGFGNATVKQNRCSNYNGGAYCSACGVQLAEETGCGCNYPYYTGPCAPGSVYTNADYYMPCGTGVCPNCSQNCGCNSVIPVQNGCGAVFATFTAHEPINVAANGDIDLESSGGISANNGIITIPATGIYHAVYTVYVPEGVSMHTVMNLMLNGSPLACARTCVNSLASLNSPASFTGHAVFRAEAASSLELRSSEAIVFSGTSTQAVFTLTLFRVG